MKTPASLGELQIEPASHLSGPGTVRIYRRDFAYGAVIVNPTREKLRCPLHAEFYNVSVGGVAPKITAVEVGAGDAVFLIRAT